MFEFLKEILLPILLVIIPLVSLRIENQRLKKRNILLKEEVEDASLGLEMDLALLNSIQEMASKILISTKAERFLILTATNGKRDLRFANAIYEHHDTSPRVNLSIGATGKYVRFEFDSHYREMLKQAERYGYVSYDVGAMQDCDLKYLYDAEEVTYSNVFFLIRTKIDENNDRMFYCSIATHQEKPFTQAETMIMKAHLSGLKSSMEGLL
jgi:hypothetical protein